MERVALNEHQPSALDCRRRHYREDSVGRQRSKLCAVEETNERVLSMKKKLTTPTNEV